MFKKLLILLAVPVVFVACKKSSAGCGASNPTTVAPDNEVTALQAYLSGAGLLSSSTLHPNKFYYIIDQQGTGSTPNICSSVSVSYQGKLTNGTTFDQGDAAFGLNQVIKGWQLGMQLVKKGGKIKLFLPPSLGYGAAGNGPIPGNAILIFEVTLNDVQ